MSEEIVACILDKDIRFLHSGQISKHVFPMTRKKAHQNEISHLIIRFFVVSFSPNNQVLYLIQKRSKSKENFPEYYTDSASGHVLYKKNLKLGDIEEEAKRELEEEFGIPPKFIEKLVFYDLISEEDKKSTEVAYVFLGLVKHNVHLNPNPDELETKESRFYDQFEMLNLLKNERLVDHSKQIWKKLLDTDLLAKFGVDNTTIKKQPSKKNIALFVGRFQPLHHGHIYILTKILKHYKKLKIGIGSSQLSKIKSDPFTYEERVNFISSALNKRGISSNRFKIFPIPDIFNANKWVDHVLSIVGEFDTIFSNSDWVRQLFHNKGINIGEKIEIFKKKYNGSNVRKLISKENKNWKNLVPKEIANLIEEYNGIELIKTLFNKEDLF
ncbi:MAG: nicotinamide-nucleotide adenylyltransferase [Candidatus Lokiarchaeota archaeon]|nr:nicotinamide-nucleotide adenylyltransferase [Candidatus Lokiarchaeota archaeon]